MTPEQVIIVQTTWLRLLPIKAEAAWFFYQRLFELDPSLKAMFNGDMQEQEQKLVHVIDATVNGLSQFENVRPMLQDMGRRHAAYGVQDEHYGTVGIALLRTLAEGLGEDFTPIVRDAWSAAYGALATTMREAARSGTDPSEQSTKPLAGSANGNSNLQPAAGDANNMAGRARLGYLAGMLALVALIGWGVHLNAGGVRVHVPARGEATPSVAGRTVTTTGGDSSRFLLNALLAPAIDTDAVPLRWVDPRQAMGCGPHTTAQVNGMAITPGATVPDAPFELEWHSDGCRPFGRFGPRFEGRVKFTVYREDWGFSASVESTDLRAVSAGNQVVLIEPGAVSMPQQPDADRPIRMNQPCDGRASPCR